MPGVNKTILPLKIVGYYTVMVFIGGKTVYRLIVAGLHYKHKEFINHTLRIVVIFTPLYACIDNYIYNFQVHLPNSMYLL